MGTSEGKPARSFNTMAIQLGLAAFVTGGAEPGSLLLSWSPRLAALLGHSDQPPKDMSLAELVRRVPELSDPLVLGPAELIHVDGSGVPAFLARSPLDAGASMAWVVFEANPSKSKMVGWMRQLAHEINNPLTSVLWKLELVSRELPDVADQPSRLVELSRHLKEAHLGIIRAVELVREFTASVYSSEVKLEAVDIEEVLKESLAPLRCDIERSATLVEDFVPVPLVLGNRSRLQQVFANLLINAVQAVQDAAPPQDHRIRLVLRASPPWVIASVEDTGVGIPHASCRRIFEAFVTTRAERGGSGLGLFISRELVECFGGRLEVQSSPLLGSSFRVWLKSTGAAPRRDRSLALPTQNRSTSG